MAFFRVSSGGTGTLSITANGTYDVQEYASAYVNVIPTLTTTTLLSNTYTTGNNWSTTYTLTDSYNIVIAVISGAHKWNESASVNISMSNSSILTNVDRSGSDPRYGDCLMVQKANSLSRGATITFNCIACYNGCYGAYGIKY